MTNKLRAITREDAGLLAELWTRGCGEAFALTVRAMDYNLRPPMDAVQVGRIALVNETPVGFVLASVLNGHADVAPPELGWVDALVVAQGYQWRGVGSELLAWAEEWLRGQGRTTLRLCGSLHPFAPGTATEWQTRFFREHGFAGRDENPVVRDFGLDLGDYETPAFLRKVEAVCRAATAEDIEGLREFLAREFPGRWLYELEQHLRDGARISEYWLLESERGIEACCVMMLEDSVRPVERYYPAPLPRPWGQVGSIGVSADRRSAGYGSALLDAALRHMRDRGVRGCIIDWTHLVGYYERFGFQPHREYEVMVKQAAD